MGTIKIRFLVIQKGRAYWQPTKTMRAAGFQRRPLGPPGPDAWAEAERLNAAWDASRRGQEQPSAPVVPGSFRDVFDRYRRLGVWASKKPRTREEWIYVWGIIEPVWADVPMADVDAELVDRFYTRIHSAYSLHKAHRVMKIFRAMLEVGVAMKVITDNPTLIVENKAPAGRSQIWSQDEVMLLAACSWHCGFHGLSVAIRIAYDTQLSPVDVRLLTPAQRRADPGGTYFDTARAKSGKRALGTVSAETEALLDRYLAGLAAGGITILDTAPLIRHRSGAAYTKDKLGQDFRRIRDRLWIGEARQLLDMRRTGNVEAAVGGAKPQELSAKQGNTIAQSNALFETYTPTQLTAVRQADTARTLGRRRLKGE